MCLTKYQSDDSQNILLQKQLFEVVNYIPFYKKFKSRKVSLQHLPIINKDTFLNNISLMLSDRYCNICKELSTELRSINQFPQDLVEYAFSNEIIIEKTSGSSGIVFKCAKTIQERSLIGVNIWKQRRQYSLNITPKTFLALNHTGTNYPKYSVYDYSLQNIINIYYYIKKIKVATIHIQTKVIIDHIERLKKNNIEIKFPFLKYIEVNGSYLSNQEKKLIENYFDIEIINQYGTMETWAIALSCCHSTLHVNTKSVYLEIIDDEGNQISEYNKIGRIIITTLIPKLMPFIRYDTGDYGCYIPKKCKCNMGYQTIKLIEGRDFNIIKGTSVKIFGIPTFKKILVQIKKQDKMLSPKFIQIIQVTENSFKIFLTRIPNIEKFISLFKSHTQQIIKREIEIDVEFIDESEVPNYHSKKFFLFMSFEIKDYSSFIRNI